MMILMLAAASDAFRDGHAGFFSCPPLSPRCIFAAATPIAPLLTPHIARV